MGGYQNGSWGNIVGRCGLDASGLGSGPVVGSREQGTEPMNSINGREFLDQLSGSAPWS
jgi:hypothetical protein